MTSDDRPLDDDLLELLRLEAAAEDPNIDARRERIWSGIVGHLPPVPPPGGGGEGEGGSGSSSGEGGGSSGAGGSHEPGDLGGSASSSAADGAASAGGSSLELVHGASEGAGYVAATGATGAGAAPLGAAVISSGTAASTTVATVAAAGTAVSGSAAATVATTSIAQGGMSLWWVVALAGTIGAGTGFAGGVVVTRSSIEEAEIPVAGDPVTPSAARASGSAPALEVASVSPEAVAAPLHDGEPQGARRGSPPPPGHGNAEGSRAAGGAEPFVLPVAAESDPSAEDEPAGGDDGTSPAATEAPDAEGRDAEDSDAEDSEAVEEGESQGEGPDDAEPGEPIAAEATPGPAAEARLVASARRSMRGGRVRAAVDALIDHGVQYPSGILAEERERLLVEGYVRLGDQQTALLRGANFLRRYPESIHRRAVLSWMTRASETDE